MLKRSLVAVALVLAVPAVGCGGTVQSEPPATAETATTRAPITTAVHGPVKLFGEALGDVPLTASQRSAIEELATQAETRHATVRAAQKDLLLALASQVEAGAVDRTALQPKIAAVTSAMQASQPADRLAFEQLHAILSPDQRSAFVDAVKAHAGAHMGEMKGKHPMHEMAAELGLTDDQKAQIKAAMEARFAARKHDDKRELGKGKDHGDAVMAAFKQDAFSFDQVAPPQDVSAHAGKFADHVLSIAEVAVPILTPEQRATAAQKIRERVAAGDPGLLEH